MRFFTEFLIILVVSFVGEVIHYFVPLPVPASIYGLVIMFLLLRTGFLKLDQVKDTGTFLIEVMPLMFVPAGVGLITSFDTLRPLLVPFVTINFVTLMAVMLVTGQVSQYFIRKSRKGEDDKGEEVAVNE